MPINSKNRGLITLLLLLFLLPLMGQKAEDIEYKIIGVDLYCYLDKQMPQAKIDSMLQSFDIKPAALKLYHQKQLASASKWQVVELSAKRIVLRKPLKSLEGQPSEQKSLMEVLDLGPKSYVHDYQFGYNLFSKPSVLELENGKTRFFLKVEGAKPESIFLSGTFNRWSTSANPMEPCDSGYFADVKLEEGAHYYKFIVNGYWFLDPRNRLKENDWEGNENSVYFKENHRFFLADHSEAEEVHVAGSFTDWELDPHGFQKVPGGWERPCFIREGTHAYKFVVDGQWITDPANPVVRKDSEGNENSFMAIGDTFYFYLPGHLKAVAPVVAGSFNDWNEVELKMFKTDSGWVLPYVLPPGNYEYKFAMDLGTKWLLDPKNPYTIANKDYKNSVLSIGPSRHFFYPAQEGVEQVYLSGDFNGWSEEGYAMERRADGWHMDLYLPKGKTRYKFILDEKWVRDPSNALFEPNEYGDFNSVIWIK